VLTESVGESPVWPTDDDFECRAYTQRDGWTPRRIQLRQMEESSPGVQRILRVRQGSQLTGNRRLTLEGMLVETVDFGHEKRRS
jgi:hypothetical protein